MTAPSARRHSLLIPGTPGPALSAAASRGGLPPTPVLVNGLLIHMLGVGLPAALFAHWALRPRA